MRGLVQWLTSRLYKVTDSRSTAAGIRTSLFPLQDLFNEELGRRTDPYPALAHLIAKRAEAQGLRLSKRRRRMLEDQLRKGGKVELSGWDLHWKWWEDRTVDVSLTDQETRSFFERLPDVTADLPRMVEAVIENTLPTLLSGLQKDYWQLKRRRARDRQRSEEGIELIWREPLGSLELLIEIAERIALSLAEHHRREPPQQKRLAEVQTRLHARGVQIGREILTLLRSGYAEAAMARWRSLHELVVVASVIKEFGLECASEYAEHTAIANYKAARKYQDAAERLGFESIASEEMAELRSAHDALVAKHGAAFKGEFGWAAKYLRNPAPGIADLEKAAKLEHMRPFYGMASDNVHAGPRGLLAKLGTMREDLLPMGPSPLGLADPGQSAALSLSLLIGLRMTLHPVIDTIILARAAGLLAVQARDQFVSTQDRIREIGSPWAAAPQGA